VSYRSKTYQSKIILVFLAITCLFALTSCEEDVQVNLGIDRPFSVWGVLNPTVPVNGIRVFEILPTIQVLQRDAIDAVVEVTNLTTGIMETWQDSVVTLRDGDFRHVYWSDTPIEYNHSYEIVTRRSDGEQVKATVTVPDSVRLEVVPDDSTQISEIFVPIEVIGSPPNLTKVIVTYTVTGQDVFSRTEVFAEIPLSYTGTQEITDRGFSIPIELRRDLNRIGTVLAEEEIILEIAQLRNSSRARYFKQRRKRLWIYRRWICRKP